MTDDDLYDNAAESWYGDYFREENRYGGEPVPEMRILTVRQPWAWAIIHGGKDVENRVRNLAGDYRGPVAIHAGLAPFNDDAFAESAPLYRTLMRAGRRYRDGALDDLRTSRAIIGVVDLVDVHFGPFAERWDVEAERNARCSEWAEPDAFHLVLANPRPLKKPIPFKGALGLRRLDADTIARIMEALA